MADMLGVDRRVNKENSEYQKIKMGVIPGLDDENALVRYLQFYGKLVHKEKGVETGEYSKRYDKSRYRFMLFGPYNFGSDCCKVMKKRPFHKYAKETGRKPITAQMASESQLRTEQWLKNGCNGFEMKSPISNPMSFWTEQDVLLYFYLYITPYVVEMWKLASNGHGSKRKKARKFLKRWRYTKTGLCSVYGEVVIDYQAMGQVDGQIDFSEYGIFDKERPLLKTTGCDRTGCMFCGYGCHLEKSPGRFERMKITHPKQYDFIMKPWSEGGLGYKELIDWINEHGGLNIKY